MFSFLYRLRAAVSMASWRAVMMTSGSTPFSFESASMVCCSGLAMSKFHFQIRACHQPQWHPVLSAIVAVNQRVVAVHAGEPSLQERLPVHRFPRHDLRATAGEALKIRSTPQRAVESRRRHLEGVLARNEVLDVQQRAQVAADVGAILDAYAVFGCGGGSGAVDLHPKHHAICLA